MPDNEQFTDLKSHIESLPLDNSQKAELLEHVQKAEDKSREQIKAARLFGFHVVANLVHEVRTSVSSAVAYSDLLLYGVYGDITDKQRDWLERIQRNGTVAFSIFDRLLDLAKIEMGKFSINPEPLEILPFVKRMVDGAHRRAGKQKHPVTLNCPSDIGNLSTDDVALGIILDCFLNTQFFPLRCPDAISVSRLPEKILFELMSTKPYLEPEQVKRVNDGFREKDAFVCVFGDLPELEFTLIARLTHRLQGEVSVESTPEKGTVYRLLLPDL